MDGGQGDRSEALARIVEESRGLGDVTTTADQPRGRRFKTTIVLCACLVAIIAGTAAYVYSRYSSPQRRTSTTALAIVLDHSASLGCASAPAWSPDGRLIAVLGTQQSCAAISNAPDDTQALYFFDGATGRLGRILKLEPLLQPLFLSTQFYGGCHTFYLSLCYDHIAWSPDGQRLAVLLTNPQPDPTMASYVLVVVESHGASIQLIKGGTFTQPTNSQHVEWALWDLQGKAVQYSQEPDSFNTTSQLVWSRNGTLAPGTSEQPAATSPVGDPPSGSAAFSPWQPGNIMLAGGPLLSSSYWAWSPDGRYLATGLATQIGLGDASATPLPGANMGYGTAAPRDEALTAVLSQAQAQPIHGESGFEVAWTPAGDYLAELRCTSAPGRATLSIWKTHTGAHVVSTPVTLSQENADCLNLSPAMSWSPGGSQLALVSPTTGGIAVVAPQLP